MAKPSPCFRERIITNRAKSYEKIRLEIWRRFKNEHSIINNKFPGRNFINTKKIVKNIDELIKFRSIDKSSSFKRKVS